MTRAQKIAFRLRWFLLVLWILCLACGIFWLVGVLFVSSFGVGLAGTPAMAVLGPLYPLIEGSESWGYLLVVLIYLAFFFMTQWFFLSPRHVWKIKLKPTARPMKRAAVGAAFAIMLLSVGLLYSILDLFGEDTLDDLSSSFSGEIRTILTYLFLLIPLILWCFWSVIFCIYWRQSDYYTWSGRVIRGLIAGSVLELFVAIPIYATRQEECYCARGSYAGLIFGGTILLWAFGPGVFLLFVREKHRRDKLSEFQENNVSMNTT